MNKFRVFTICLGIVTIAAVAWFLHAADQAYRQGELRSIRWRRTHTAGPVNSDSIQTWMTFEYLNAVFKLPPAYLQNLLQINDPRYPRLSINRYAKQSGIDQGELVTRIRAAIQSYQGSSR